MDALKVLGENGGFLKLFRLAKDVGDGSRSCLMSHAHFERLPRIHSRNISAYPIVHPI